MYTNEITINKDEIKVMKIPTVDVYISYRVR